MIKDTKEYFGVPELDHVIVSKEVNQNLQSVRSRRKESLPKPFGTVYLPKRRQFLRGRT